MTWENSPFAGTTEFTSRTTGNHYSHFYESAEDLAAAVVPFMAAGVRNNEQCLWVTAEPFEKDQAVAALAALFPDLTERMACGQIEIVGHGDWYTAAGGFHAATVIEGWLERERRALRSGYAGLRITGNTFWLDTAQDFRDFSDYEERLHAVLQGRKINCLCSYCISKGSAKDIIDVVRNHDFAVIRRGGDWEVIESASLKAAKNELSARLRKKENLLSEIHHRVKNNLQIVSSLLMLKSREFGSPTAAQALEDTLSRISAMAMVHQMLYENDDGGSINLYSYLDRLTGRLSEAYGCSGNVDVAMVMNRAIAPTVCPDTAVPLGIAVTEAVINAIKHAFPGNRAGRVVVGIEEADGDLHVVVEDDGQGCDATTAAAKTGTGLALIEALARQIGARLDISCDRGTSLRLVLPDRRSVAQ